jgi:hypothetical protein
VTAGPAWLADVLAAVMAAIAAYEVGRLSVAAATGRTTERDVDAFHLAMGVSMAGMLTDHLTPFSAEAWAVFFGGMTVWFATRVPWAVAVHTNAPPSLGHRLSHVVSSGAMVYMLLAVPSGAYAPGGMRAMASAGGTRLPALAVLLALALVAGTFVHGGRGLLGAEGRPQTDGAAVRADAPGAARASGRLAARLGIEAPVSAPFLAPGMAAACQVAMGLVMAYMLLTMA